MDLQAQRLYGQPNALLDSLLPRLGSPVDYLYLTYSNYQWDVTYGAGLTRSVAQCAMS